jgi:hypothetical protein
MNAWKVNKLFNEHFPPFETANLNWVNVQSSDGPKVEVLTELVQKYINASEILININRKFGAKLIMQEAIMYICKHMGNSQIRVSNREFTQFVVVSSNCVATGWQIQANPTFKRDALKRAP